MNNAEEKAMELEALSAIFGEQFQQRNGDDCIIETLPNADIAHISCYLEFSFPSKYPEVLPEIVIKNIKGLSDNWNDELKQKLLTFASDLIGSPMVFQLVEVAKEWLTERNLPGVGEESMHSQMLAQELAKKREQTAAAAKSQVDAEKTKATSSKGQRKSEPGTPVTAENFTKWMTQYIKEELTTQTVSTKLTGRQLFEGGTLKLEEQEVDMGAVGEEVEDFDKDLIGEEDVDLDELESDDENDGDE